MAVPCKRKVIVGLILSSVVFTGILATKPPREEKPVYKNLKVLSKDISEENMDLIMEGFNVQLGVRCIFCHVHKEEGYIYTIDDASDSLLNKRIARDMMRMTMKLNKKYFNVKLNGRMTTQPRIWCKTCHRGKPIPILKSSLQ
jgi:hypothetical protein